VRLVTVAHGTRHPTGNRVAAALTEQAAARLGMPAQAAYVELCAPLFAEVMADPPADGATRLVVPLLLSTGYHVRHDLPAALRPSAPRAPALLAGPLGPDPLLAAAQVERLRAAGARPGQPVVMLAAGSNDVAAARDLQSAADLLATSWGAPVRLAVLAGLGPRPEEVVRAGDAVSPYLLAPGFFARRAAATAQGLGAGVVADPIGVHPLVVDLVVARVRALLAPARATA
jgi:sirohydrochlorin ferrochelatase